MNDNMEMADIAEETLTTQDVFISSEVLAEVVYVLSGVYEIPKEDIANQLLELVDFENIAVANHTVVKESLEIFKAQSLDFVDCLLCAHSRQDEIATFDKQLNKCVQNLKT